jgi:short-subunit dehydrogenase
MDWEHSVVLITGASSGIGLELAKRVRKKGARVALVARTVSNLESLAASLGHDHAQCFPMDVTNREQLQALPEQVVERFGRLDMVVNNAGVNVRGPVHKRSAEELTSILETNLVAPILLTHASLPLLHSGGVIVNIASLAGKIPLPDEATYSASKFGLRAFGRALDMEQNFHSSNPIRIISVCPGPVDTGFFGDDLSQIPDIVFSQPMSSAQEVAAAVIHAVEQGRQEVDIPQLSGKLATMGYLSPAIYLRLRKRFEQWGAYQKKKFMAKKRSLFDSFLLMNDRAFKRGLLTDVSRHIVDKYPGFCGNIGRGSIQSMQWVGWQMPVTQ